MLVVHLVGASQRFGVSGIGVAKPLKALMYEHIVHQEVGQPIGQYTQAYSQAVIENLITPQHEISDTHRCVKNKKGIVTLKNTVVISFVVVRMQVPQETVHHIFVGGPGHTLHTCKNPNKYQNVDQNFHQSKFN
jgi:hypothetical protein